MIDGGNRVLPHLRFVGNLRTKVARDWTHVTMRQLEPGLRECVGELLRVLIEATRNLFVGRIEPQREIGREHVGSDLLRLVMGRRDRAFTGTVLRLPLFRASGALGQLPLVLEQVLEEIVAPLGWRRRPRDLETAGDRMSANAGLITALPAESLLFEIATLRFPADVRHRRSSTVRLAERMTAGDEGNRLFVVHRHAAERLSNIARGGLRIGI